MFCSSGWSQCTITSSNGYTVTVSFTPTTVVAPSSCPNGYNYNVNIQYSVVFSGTNIPPSLFTLQGNLVCSGANSFFNLPNSGGSGTTTTTGNQYTSMTNCATATPTSQNCTTIGLIIQGPGINYQTINCPFVSSLPVELMEFTGTLVNNQYVNLNWLTSSEKNNDYFVVERSIDGDYWEKLSDVKGAGNSDVLSNYEYTDVNPLREKVSYYRLKQVDFDGNFEYSNIISINRIPSNSIFLFPNPSANLITIEGLDEPENEIEIYSIDGKRISDVIRQNMGNSSVTLEISNLPAGTYLVRTKKSTLRFIKE